MSINHKRAIIVEGPVPPGLPLEQIKSGRNPTLQLFATINKAIPLRSFVAKHSAASFPAILWFNFRGERS